MGASHGIRTQNIYKSLQKKSQSFSFFFTTSTERITQNFSFTYFPHRQQRDSSSIHCNSSSISTSFPFKFIKEVSVDHQAINWVDFEEVVGKFLNWFQIVFQLETEDVTEYFKQIFMISFKNLSSMSLKKVLHMLLC